MERFRKIAVSIVAILLVFSIGCGQKQAKETASEAKKTANEKSNVVRIAYIAGPSPAAQALVGKEEKIFENELTKKGLTVQWIPIKSRDKVWPLMDKDGTDFIYLNSANFFTYATQTSEWGGSNKYTVLAGSTDNKRQFNLVVKPEIKSIKELDGQNVGIVNEDYMEEMLLNKELETVGLKTKAVGGTVNVNYHKIMVKFLDDFAAGKYPAISCWTSTLPDLKKRYPTARVLSPLTGGWKAQPYVYLVGRKEFVNSEPEVVKAVLTAHLAATEKAQQKWSSMPAMAKQVSEDYFKNVLKAIPINYPLAYYENAWANVMPTYKVNIDFIKEIYSFEVKAGYLKGKSIEDLVNTAPLKEVLQERGKK